MSKKKWSKYACVTFRSNKFHKEFSLQNYSRGYQEYSDTSAHRNTRMDSVRFTIKKLSDRGYYVLLMGKESTPDELIFDYDKYILYSRDYRTDFLDMYLFMHSDIVVGLGGSQAFTFGLFRENCLSLDFPDIWVPESVYSMTLTLPKHIYSNEKKRFLSPKERILTTPTYDLNDATALNEKYIDNLPEDIEKTIDEFIEIVEGKIKYSSDLNKMHKAFYSYYQLTPLTHQIDYHGGRISSAYLNRYRHELLSDNN